MRLVKLLIALLLIPTLAWAAATTTLPGPPDWVMQQTNYKNITTATTTTVKSSAGLIHNLCINNPGSGGTITIYDSTTGSGTTIGTVTATSTTIVCFAYDVFYLNGLTIVTSASMDITVTWY